MWRVQSSCYASLYVFLLLFSGPIFSDDGLEETITIVRSIDDWGPNEFMGEDGTPTGFHIDLIRMAAEELNVKIKFLSMPWKRALDTIEKGEVDYLPNIYVESLSESNGKVQIYAFDHEGKKISFTFDRVFIAAEL